MAERKIKNIIRDLKISLSEDEKATLRSNLISEILKKEAQGAKSVNNFKKPAFYQILFSRYAATIASLILIFTGTSAFAQNSLPGDILYPFKVNVNEKIANLFVISLDSKATRELALLEKRLEEAGKLAEEGRLSSERSQLVEKQIDKHSSRVRANIEALESGEKFDKILALQSDLEISLNIHEKLLSVSDDNGDSQEVKKIASRVKDELLEVSKSRAQIQENLNRKPQADFFTVAKERQSIAREMIKKLVEEENKKTDISGPSHESLSVVEISESSDDLMSQIKIKFNEAESLLEVGLYRESIDLFNEIIRALREERALGRTEGSVRLFERKSETVSEQTEREEGQKGEVQGEFRSDELLPERSLESEKIPAPMPDGINF